MHLLNLMLAASMAKESLVTPHSTTVRANVEVERAFKGNDND